MRLSLSVSKKTPSQYQARCSDLPGCVGSGATAAEAVYDFCRSARGYLAAATNFVAGNPETDFDLNHAVRGIGSDPVPPAQVSGRT